jgi:hypothetical protein
VDTKKEVKPSPLKPYDDSMWDHWSLYDNVPYVQDMDLRTDHSLAKESGNIIKSYRCLIKEPYEVKH